MALVHRLCQSHPLAAALHSGRGSLATRRFAAESKKQAEETGKLTWWNNPAWWGAGGAIAGWGMTGAAMFDASTAGPEIISLNMTSVMIVYSSLFCRWAMVVKPQNLLLASCHASNVVAQCNQVRATFGSTAPPINK